MRKYWVGALLLIIVCSCSKPAAFEFRGIRDIRLRQSALNNSALSATLTFFNPNRYTVQIKNISSDVYLNNDFIAHYNLDTLIKVPGNSLFDFNASVNFATERILKNALSTFFNKEATIHIVGRSKVGRSGFFVNVPFDVSSKQKLPF